MGLVVVVVTLALVVRAAQAEKGLRLVFWANILVAAVVGKGMQDQPSTPLVGLAVVMVAAVPVVSAGPQPPALQELALTA